MSGRDTSRDGFKNKAELWALTSGGWLWRALQRSPLEAPINRALIDSGIDKTAARPYALSTKADYTSWDTLTDRRYNSRSLPPVSQEGLPDVEKVAALFKREEMIPCEKSTVLFAYVAQWFTDGFLRSVRDRERDPAKRPTVRDITRNESTHEVDLTQLYGVRPDLTERLRSDRARGDGLLLTEPGLKAEFPPYLCEDGRVKPQFDVPDLTPIGFTQMPAEHRPHVFAMGSDASNLQIGYAMLNVLFLREHNRLARGLAETDEARGWPVNAEARSDRIFGTARNILTAMLIKLVIEEYINHIAPYHFQFRFAPGKFERSKWMRPNWVAVEFNLLYRWHSLLPSQIDAGGESIAFEQTLYNMKLLADHGIGTLFEEASGQHAGRVGLHNTNAWLWEKADKPSIVQARHVRLARYNAYREYCKFPAVTKFEQITENADVRRELRDLYGTVDNIEFFPGLFAEDRRPNSVLPSMVGRLVGMHAFSQLMTNPLVAPEVYNERTFTAWGLDQIASTTSLRQLLNRNLPEAEREYDARLTHRDWKRSKA